MTINDGGPAFPGPAQSSLKTDQHEGMSLRDHYAGLAMQALVGGFDAMMRAIGEKNRTVPSEAIGQKITQLVALAGSFADAMIAERAKAAPSKDQVPSVYIGYPKDLETARAILADGGPTA